MRTNSRIRKIPAPARSTPGPDAGIPGVFPPGRKNPPSAPATLMGMGEAVEQAIRRIGPSENDEQLRQAFEQAAGPQICAHAYAVRNDCGKLLVCVDSSVAMQEIMFKRLEIIQKVNEILRKRAVTSLRFRVFAGAGNGHSTDGAPPPDFSGPPADES